MPPLRSSVQRGIFHVTSGASHWMCRLTQARMPCVEKAGRRAAAAKAARTRAPGGVGSLRA
eukprot:205878-Chlamydomonas_euryale.AAC.1